MFLLIDFVVFAVNTIMSNVFCTCVMLAIVSRVLFFFLVSTKHRKGFFGGRLADLVSGAAHCSDFFLNLPGNF